MARTYGKVLLTIWRDDEFRSLGAGAQRLYLFLVSHPDLTAAGTLPYRPTKWAKAAADLTLAQVDASARELTAGDYIMVDHEAEEVLVRSFIKNDESYRVPNMLKALRAAIKLVESDHLRARAEWELGRALGEVEGPPPEPIPEPIPEPLRQPILKPVPEPIPEGIPNNAPHLTSQLNSPAPPKSASGRKPNELWDVLSELFAEPATKTEKTNRGRIVRELNEVGATPDDVRSRFAEHSTRRSSWTLTENALLTHWTDLAPRSRADDIDSVLGYRMTGQW